MSFKKLMGNEHCMSRRGFFVLFFHFFNF